jgi:lipopolysaccharide/colanic/teichoic acid biosynthesis glycosyltransferase
MSRQSDQTKSPFLPASASNPLRVLLIGGTGFIGQQLLPKLESRGHKVSVASRTEDPAHGILGREDWHSAIANADVVLLLSVINSNTDASVEEVRSVNVTLPLEIAKEVSKHSAKRLILFGSDHQDAAAVSAYAASKADLTERLLENGGLAATLLILSPVHGVRFVKRVAFVDSWPGQLRIAAILAFGAFRPLTHIDKIVEAIERIIPFYGEAILIHRIVDDQNCNIVYRAAIRFFDLAFALLVLLVFGWAMVILAMLITTTSTGPALFQQQRVGRNGEPFTCYKFRTMRIDTPQVPTHQVAADSTTRIGKFLRGWKLDELPQIFNIIANDMSLVGPRPSLTTQDELIAVRSKLGVFAMKPGVTGWSQVRGIDMSDPEKLAKSDSEFCSRRSIVLYCVIVIQTFLGRGLGDRIR